MEQKIFAPLFVKEIFLSKFCPSGIEPPSPTLLNLPDRTGVALDHLAIARTFFPMAAETGFSADDAELIGRALDHYTMVVIELLAFEIIQKPGYKVLYINLLDNRRTIKKAIHWTKSNKP